MDYCFHSGTIKSTVDEQVVYFLMKYEKRMKPFVQVFRLSAILASAWSLSVNAASARHTELIYQVIR